MTRGIHPDISYGFTSKIVEHSRYLLPHPQGVGSSFP